MDIIGKAPDQSLALAGAWGETRFRDLRRLVREKKAGLSRGGVALLTARAEPDFVAEALACLEAGNPCALVPPDLSGAELRQRRGLLERPAHPDAALILFTSGSTGGPKAVQISAESVRANTAAVIDTLAFAQAASQTLFLPLSYAFGFLGQLLPALSLGIPTYFPKSLLEAREILLRGHASGMWSGVPAQWAALLPACEEGGGRGITHLVSAGEALPLSMRERLREHFPRATIFQNYGLTEASPRVLSLSSAHPAFWEESATGLPVPGISLRIGEGGELLVRGPQVMLGYLGDEAATAQKIAAGWLCTGDMASLDENGIAHVFGRRDELFKIGGERASPHEIEAALSALPGVRDAAVFVAKDELYGARIQALLVVGGDFVADRWALLEDLKEELSGNKIPSEFFLVERLPRTANGKLRRAELPALLGGAKALR